MKLKLIRTALLLELLITSCSVLHRQNSFNEPSSEIQIDKTEMKNVEKLTGQADDEFLTFACGNSSGHVSGWTTYKKLGIAFYSVSYTPARQDGYKNGLIRNIGIFDSTDITVRKSPQQKIYYGKSFYPISKANLKLLFGKPDKIKTVDTIQYIFYNSRQLIFAFNKANMQFAKLFVTNKK